MKKIFAMILILAMMIPTAAWACTETTAEAGTVLAFTEETETERTTETTYSDPAWWPLTEDHILAGIKDYGEKLHQDGVPHVDGMYVAGLIDHGWMRTDHEILTVDFGGQIIGLTQLTNTSITLYDEFIPVAETAVHELFGCDVALSQNAMVAGATWYNGNYASLIFHPSYSDRFVIGYATFNITKDNPEGDRTPFYLGHFGNQWRFGLACGWWLPKPVQANTGVQTGVTVEADAGASISVQAQASATATASASVAVTNSGSINNSGDGCYRNNLVVQVNLFSVVRNVLEIIKECVNGGQ